MRILSLPNFWLLIALVSLIIIYPIAYPYSSGRAFLALFDWIILILALRASKRTWYKSWLGYAFAIPAMSFYVITALFSSSAVIVASLVTQALFHGFIVISLLRYM